MVEIILSTILLIISILSFFISVRSFMQKGFLFNNAYIYATKKERESMNKKTYYMQSAIVFLLIGIIFLLNAIAVILKIDWFFYIVIALVISVAVFAIISSVIIEKDNK